MTRNHALRLCLSLLLLPVSTTLAKAQAKDVTPGDTLQVMTSTELSTSDTITVTLNPEPPSSCTPPPPPITVSSPPKTGFSIVIPPAICTGAYDLQAKRAWTTTNGANTTTNNADLAPTPAVIHVLPVVTAIDPKVLYDETTLTFLGPISLKFDSKEDPNYTVAFQDHALPKCKDSDTTNCFSLDDKNSQSGQIKFEIHGNFLTNLSGKQTVFLVHNGAQSAPQAITIVGQSKNTPRNYAFGLTTVLVVLVYFLLNAGRKGLQGGTRTYLLTALFLDEETKTYSLSKCQFYAWTLAAVLGYVFFAFSKSLIQGSAVFPDIPDGLPGILLASAGTSVLATGITSSKGSKGAGEDHPTLADFITSGGVVAPERLQFVIWTVVGIVTFLTIVFKSDPATLSELPKIPPGFLELMGISSAGYLGGKLARKPGPVVQGVSVANVTDDQHPDPPNQYLVDGHPPLARPVLTLNIKGENLDPKAKIKVDDKPLRGDQYWIQAGAPDPQTQFCSELNVSLNAAAAYLEKDHKLTLVNSDSQASDVKFPIDCLAIDSITLPANNAAGDATVAGKNFVKPTYYQWLNNQGVVDNQGLVNAAGHPYPEAAVLSPTGLTVSRPNAAITNSGYTLTLISQVGLKASKKI